MTGSSISLASQSSLAMRKHVAGLCYGDVARDDARKLKRMKVLGKRSGIETLASKSNDAEIFSDTCAAKCQGSQSLSLSLEFLPIYHYNSICV